MLQSSPKRQRITTDVFVSRQGQDGPAFGARSHPTTPTRRASYLSPTKASLARSHPNLLAKSPKVSATDLSEQLPAAESSIAIAQAFNDAANERQSVTGSTQPQVDESTLTEPSQSTQKRSRYLRGNEAESAQPIQPKLVPRTSASRRAASRASSDEPDLPPTPVQLGISEAPGRPRGLGSSSGGSRSGSDKHRRRVRPGQTRAITSSPLKPNRFKNVHIRDQQASDNGMPDEEMDGGEPSEELQRKQTEFLELQKQLEALRTDLNQLEILADKLENDANFEVDDAAFRLVTGDDPNSQVNTTSLESHPRFIQNPSAYLNLFAPGNLNLKHTTHVSQLNHRTKVVHRLSIAAPEPWPNSVFQLSFEMQVDGTASQIESVKQMRHGSLYRHDSLHRWIDRRLQDPLHRFDVGGTVQGAGHYFSETVKRATVFQHLARVYGHSDEQTLQVQHIEKLSSHDMMALQHYIDTTQMTFRPTMDSPRSPAMSSKQILLTYELRLSPVSVVSPAVGITVTGVGLDIQKSAMELFGKILTTEGPIAAFDSVWKILKIGE